MWDDAVRDRCRLVRLVVRMPETQYAGNMHLARETGRHLSQGPSPPAALRRLLCALHVRLHATASLMITLVPFFFFTPSIFNYKLF